MPLLHAAFYALACTLLAGCATTDITLDRVRSNEVVFQADQGIVVLDVATNGDVSTLVDKWNGLAVKNIDTGKVYVIHGSEPQHVSRSLFVGTLPAGTYSLDQLRDARGTGVSNVWTSAKLGESLGRFRIEPKRVTNLGGVAYLRERLAYDNRKYWIEFLPSNGEFERTLDQLDPSVANAAKAGTLTWLPAAGSELRPAKSGRFNGLSFYLHGPYHAKDGSLYFGEALGQIARRDHSGRWTWLQTGAASPILSVTQLEDGAILAGSEQGFLFLKKANEARWTTIPFPRTNASIRFVGTLPGVGYVAVVQDKDNIRVLSTPDLEKPTWSELQRMPSEFTLPAGKSSFRTWINGGRLTVARNSPAPLNPRRIQFHEFDANLRSWKTNTSTLSIIGMDAYTVLPDGSLYTVSGPPIAQNAFASTDGGATWDPRSSPNWLDSPVFRTKDEGYAIRLENTPLTDPLNTAHAIWKTTDGGNRWAMLNKTPNRAYKLMLLDAPGHMLIVTTDKRLYFTSDWGATWNLERSM